MSTATSFSDIVITEELTEMASSSLVQPINQQFAINQLANLNALQFDAWVHQHLCINAR